MQHTGDLLYSILAVVTNIVLYTVYCNLPRESIFSALNTHTDKEDGNCDVMDVLTSTVCGGDFTMYTHTKTLHHILKYVQIIFVNFAPIKWKQQNWPIW